MSSITIMYDSNSHSEIMAFMIEIAIIYYFTDEGKKI